MVAPKLRFKEFDGDWFSKKIIELADYVDYRGKTPKKVESGVLLVTAKNIKQGYLDYSTSQEFIEPSDFEDVMRRGKVELNDVLITTEAPLGNIASVDRVDIALAQRVIKYRGKPHLLDNLFLKQKFLSESFQEVLQSKATGGTVQGIKGSVLHQISLIVPFKEEQTQIATFLSSVDEKIAQLSQKHQLLSQYKQGMMQKLFSQQIRFKADDGSEFGEWEEKTLGEICQFINGRAYKQTEWEKEGIPVIRLQNLTGSGKEYYYSNLKLPDRQYCYNNDLLYMWSATFGPVFWQGEKAIFHYHIWKIEVNPSLLDKKYMYFLLDEMTEKMKRSLNGSTMLHVTKQGMEDTQKIVPSLPEQTKIANFLSSIDQKIEVVAQQIEQAKQWKKGLLQQMFV